MKFSALALVPIVYGSAFVPSSLAPSRATRTWHAATENEQDEVNTSTFWRQHVDPLQQQVAAGVATAFLSASLWASPAALMGLPQVATNVEKAAVAPWVSVANAKEMASGTGSRVNKDPESLLRLGLPINNKEVRLTLGEETQTISFVSNSFFLTLYYSLMSIRVGPRFAGVD